MNNDTSPKAFSIGGFEIGPGNLTFIIAEIGINHNGDLRTAKRLIDAAKVAGASAVKFQKRNLESIYTAETLSNLQNKEQAFQYLIPILEDYELTPDEMWELKNYCDKIGILFLCTPFDVPSAKLLEQMDIPGFKISSADLTNFELLEQIVGFKKPMMLSTGMSFETEVDYTANYLDAAGARYALLHCVSSYPVDPRDAKIGKISYMLDKYDCPIGYSGHDIGIALSIVAVTLGATIVEKHITLDQRMRGPDHKISLLPEQLKRLVASIRDCEMALREDQERILQGEMLNKMVFRKSVVAVKNIRQGQVIEREMLGVKSPGIGLSAQKLHDLVGKQAKREFAVDEMFHDSDLTEHVNGNGVPKIGWGSWGYVVRYHDFPMALEDDPKVLEFHLTYGDTQIDVPHKLLEKYREQLSKMTLRVHCCEYINEQLFDLCSRYLDILKRSERTLQRVIDITAELAPYFNGQPPEIVFNCGAMTLKEDARYLLVNKEAFYKIIGRVNLRGTKLLAQNMPPNPWYFGGQWKGNYLMRAPELIEFCETTKHSLCLDLSHAHMACAYFELPFREYIRQLKPYVRHIHISDAHSIEGEGVQVGEGDIDFDVFFEEYSDYTGTWIPEVWLGHVNGNQGAKTALKRLAEIHERVTNSAAIDSSVINGQKRLTVE